MAMMSIEQIGFEMPVTEAFIEWLQSDGVYVLAVAGVIDLTVLVIAGIVHVLRR